MNAVIYARYSSDRQREESIEGQLRECTEYAKKNNLTLLGTYVDRALSARTADRPDFQRMIADSAKGIFDVVLVWKLDRFSRDRYDSAHYKHILKKNGVRLISIKENISDGPEGIILESGNWAVKRKPSERTGLRMWLLSLRLPMCSPTPPLTASRMPLL